MYKLRTGLQYFSVFLSYLFQNESNWSWVYIRKDIWRSFTSILPFWGSKHVDLVCLTCQLELWQGNQKSTPYTHTTVPLFYKYPVFSLLPLCRALLQQCLRQSKALWCTLVVFSLTYQPVLNLCWLKKKKHVLLHICHQPPSYLLERTDARNQGHFLGLIPYYIFILHLYTIALFVLGYFYRIKRSSSL